MRIPAALLAIALAASVEGHAFEGLDLETATALHQDRAGFVWVGTRERLIRYDGYESMTYEHDLGDPRSISDNDIRSFFEDRAGNLWVATNTGGLNRLDPLRRGFTSYRHDPADPRSLVHDSVYAVAEDRDGKIWVGTQGGLCRLDPVSGSFDRFPAGAGGPAHDWIIDLLVDRDGVLWVGTNGGGLNRRDPATGTFRASGGPFAYGLVEGDDATLWVANDVGVYRFDRALGTVTPIPFEDGGARVVTTLSRETDGTLWAGTFDTGIWYLAPGTRALRRQPIPGDGTPPVVNRIVDLMVDAGGTVWVGSWGTGLHRVTRGARQFREAGASLGRADVTAVFEDRRGSLWFGGGEGGRGGNLRRVDADGRVTSYSIDGAPLALLDRGGGRLWVGTTSGLRSLDARTGRHDTVEGVGATWVWDLIADRGGSVWIAAGERGLLRRSADGTFERFVPDPADPGTISDSYPISLLEDREGTIWIGTRSGGLNTWSPRTRAFTRHLPDPADPESLRHHNVTAVVQDRTGSVWVGTSGGGLHRAFRRTADGPIRFQRFGEAEGLVDDNVVSLVEDDDGSLWIGTRRGLSRLDPARKAFANYDLRDGLPSPEFNVGAAAAAGPRLVFGTRRGVLSIDRATSFPPREPSPTVLTSIRTLEGPLEPAASLEVRWGEALSFEAAVLDFGERGRHRYTYRLEGLQEAWVELGTRREITFTHLDPGTYVLRVRGRNDQGVWSEIPEPLRIRIVPPFWMTLWFRLLVVSSVVGLAWAWHVRRTGSLERRNRELERLQSELRVAYGRLRGLTRRLEAAKEEERKHIARELHDEMGTALTTMKLNLQLLGGSAPEEGTRRVADSIGLIDRMIGHVRELSLDLRPPLLDELGLAAALRGYLEALSRRSGIGIELRAEGVPAALPDDVAIAAFRVAQEAVTNVLRHGGAGRVEVDLGYDRAGLELTVVDDGRGFDVAAAFERAGSGRHLGLLGMRERVEAMGGSLAVESTPGSGTRVHARLPLEDGATP
ncbi:MAG TPA: two-component regulator propeller domain-containing protein [Candidatus Polarisedimenticolaceae bacterium]